MLFFSHAAAPDGVQYDALPGDLPLGERHSEASRPDFRDAFSAGVFLRKAAAPCTDVNGCCSKEVPLQDVGRKAGLREEVVAASCLEHLRVRAVPSTCLAKFLRGRRRELQ